MNRLRTKIITGVAFLFLLLLIVGGTAAYFLTALSHDANVILKDNYESLSYCHSMQQQLVMMDKDSNAIRKFNQQLQLEEKNATEVGEAQATAHIRSAFEQFKASKEKFPLLKNEIENHIQEVLALNMQAIDRKNKQAQHTATKAITIITVLGAIVFLLSFTFLANFPSYVSGPLSKLNEAIKALSDKNYNYRVHINRKDEFGELAQAFNTMAEKLDEYEHSNLATILFEKQRAETVIQTMKDASLGIDVNGKVLFANRQALQLLNLKEVDVINKSQEEVGKRNDLFRFLLQENNGTPFKIVVENKENYFTKEINDITQDGQKTGRVIVFKNITPYKELDLAKTNFIATISHELKTPLASMDLSLKLLKDKRTGDLNNEQHELVEHIKDDKNRLVKIVGELLDLSQVETGNIRLNIQSVNVNKVLDFALQSVQMQATQKQITLEIIKTSNEEMYCKADAEKTTWVLTNLLTNAIRYSSASSKIITTIKNIDSKVQFSVQDFGKGISKEEQSHIFEKFYKTKGDIKSGTGLGLAIAKDFIISQGGKIWVESEEGKGSVFAFELPKA
ncbi:HAMP domain-containing sensor histidine kinase [Pinibacter soli]|uniref:histidine kinase n=1 Tax=Pinibacter soli TaxID=3044211 RepID=A0ABT6RF01_9BACT|nr:ATP-binding protein [Pinibacter soli]MDI3320432.1 ATP-binding protein [Pinibacter soli]